MPRGNKLTNQQIISIKEEYDNGMDSLVSQICTTWEIHPVTLKKYLRLKTWKLQASISRKKAPSLANEAGKEENHIQIPQTQGIAPQRVLEPVGPVTI